MSHHIWTPPLLHLFFACCPGAGHCTPSPSSMATTSPHTENTPASDLPSVKSPCEWDSHARDDRPTCPNRASADWPQPTVTDVPAPGSPLNHAKISHTSAAAVASQHSLSAGLIVGLVLSSVLLFLMLCGIVLLFFIRWRRRRQRTGSDPSSWSRLPGYWAKQSPSTPDFLPIGSDVSVGKVPPKSQFGLYMFKFKPPASPVVMRDPSSSLPATATLQQAPPVLASATPSHWFDASGEKPPRYSRGNWVADPDSEVGGLVVQGYLPDSKEWIPPQGSEQGDHTSEWSSVPTNHAVESVPRV
jgi:hypothetical protein